MAYLEYPKHLSHKDHHTHKVVKNADEENAARAQGWDDHGNVVAAREAEKNQQSAGKSKPSATELGGAPLSLDPSQLEPGSAAVVEDAGDFEGEDGEKKNKKHGKK